MRRGTGIGAKPEIAIAADSTAADPPAAAPALAKATARHARPAIYGLPVLAFAFALLVHFTGWSVDDPRMTTRVLLGTVSTVILLATVFAALHHAEAVAHRVGEPYGTLILTAAVTTIEVSIILSMMLHGANNPTLARESVFSTVMIVSTGVLGVCLTLGGWLHRKQAIKRQGTSAYLAVLIALTVLTLILPTYTLGGTPGAFSPAQLAFVSILSVLLYCGFVFAQTVRHREDFVDRKKPQAAAATEPARNALVSLVFLMLGLIGIVLLAEQVAASIEDGLQAIHVAQADAIVGALIAGLVILPEAVAAVRAAVDNELQRSLNVALGSACASIGLTVPVIAAASLVTGRGLTLGIGPSDTVLLILALSVSTVSFGTEKTTFLTGMVHLVVFVAYFLLIFVP